MILVLAAFVAAFIVVPHVPALRGAHPATAATLWFCALALRALTVMLAVVWLLLFLPATASFQALTRWCWHAVVPLATSHLGFSGHGIGDAATLVPSFVLAGSAVSVAFGIVRATRSVRRMIGRAALGAGPAGTVIVGGAGVVLAAAGIARPRVIVSAGALTTLDDDELAAGLAHEEGHITRRHRYVLVAAELLRAPARFLPGTAQALRELAFHLERDADAFVLSRRHDPRALARVICKAALSPAGPAVAMSALNGSAQVSDRVEALIAADVGRAPWRRSSPALGTAAVAGVALVLAFSVSVAATAASGQPLPGSAPIDHCPN